jgi:TonB-linked SusC/RagA family outer membrane protein
MGSSSWAQQQVVKGTIKDNTDVLIGVSVFEKDVPSNGTSTNVNGEFSLQLKGKSGILVFRYIGYLTREIKVNGPQLNVTLEVDAKGLEEVVVVGYGTQKKITNTGALSSISGDDLRQTPSASLQNALIGRVPGIITQQRSGQPGADGARLLVRGLSTTNGNGAPLIIVDDLEYAGSISDIDPDQIESFTVLKDAATTAVYGIKGANGVIVITTKRGKVGKPQITVRSENSIQKPIYLPEYLDSYESALLVNRAIASDLAIGATPNGNPYSQEALDAFRTGSNPYKYPNVNWEDVLLKNSTFQSRNNINVQGGLDKAKYFISAGYLFQDGLLKDFSGDAGMNNNYYYKRYNFRSNLDVQPTKSLTLNLDLSGYFSEQNSPESGGRGGYNNVFNEMSQMSELAPWNYPVYNPDGSYGMSVGTTFNNIVGRLTHYGYEREYRNNLTANFRATQKLDFITKGLSIKGVLGYNGAGGFTRNLTRGPGNDFPSFRYDADAETYTPFNPNVLRIALPELSNSNIGGTRKLNWQVSANYDRTFGSNRVYALALYNFQNDIAGSAVPRVFEGYTFRAGYDYKSKYLLELNAGYNGSSAFAQADRYSLFPAVSAGWNISEEPFFKNNIKFIDLFKIRGSYGITGSDDIGGTSDYAFLAQYERSGTGNGRDTYNYNLGDNPGSTIVGIREGGIANVVFWEKEKQSNIGLEMRMFKGALSVEADVFNRLRYDILQGRLSVPWYSGYYSPQLTSPYNLVSQIPDANIGKVRNKGFETRVTYNGKVKELAFNISGNVSVAKNKRIEMDEPAKEFPWQVLTGKPIGSTLGYDYIGFYTTEDINNPGVAKPTSFPTTTFAGDLKYRDVDGDGQINDNDKIVMPYTNLPTTILGLTLGFKYKSVSFTVTAQSGLNFALSGYGQAITPFSNNFREIHKDAWTPENAENASFPRLTTAAANLSSMATAGNVSTFWYKKSDYLRIKTAEFGYNLPKALVNKVGLNSARLYVNGYNLFTWSLAEKNIYDIDPETTSGTDGRGFYPQQKVYNIGLQITL